MNSAKILICILIQCPACIATIGIYIENCFKIQHEFIREDWTNANSQLTLQGLLKCGDIFSAIRAAENVSESNRMVFLTTDSTATVLRSFALARGVPLATFDPGKGLSGSRQNLTRMSNGLYWTVGPAEAPLTRSTYGPETWRTAYHRLTMSKIHDEMQNGENRLIIYIYRSGNENSEKNTRKLEASMPSLRKLPGFVANFNESGCHDGELGTCGAYDVTMLSQSFYRIGIVESPPFMLYDLDEYGAVHNPKGIVFELINALASTMNFNYTFVPLARHGSLQPNGTWSGAIGAILEKKVDWVASDLSVTPQRVQVVDFTVPFMQGSQAVVIRRVVDASSVRDLFLTYLRPFHWSIWLVMGVCWLVATALLCTTEDPRIKPPLLTTQNGRSIRWEDRKLENRDTWWSVAFQILGLFCQQGCALSPRRASGRVVLFSTCLAALVCYNFYTSVFISFTTVTKTSTSMSSLSDVLRDKSYQVGFVPSISDSIEDVFKFSEVPAYQMAWNRMQRSDKTYVTDVEEGMARAYAEKFAFIAEIHALEWYTMKNCSFKLLEERLLSEGYCFAFPLNSPDTGIFSRYLKRVVENGLVTRLRSNVMPSLTPDFCDESGSLDAVGLDRTAGLFFCLTLGFTLAFVSLWLERVGRAQDKMVKRVIINVKKDKH